jgi:hypothetical protein
VQRNRVPTDPAAYNSPNFLPASVAGPGQTLNSGTAGTAAYTDYDSYGRVAYTLALSQAAGQPGAQTNYTCGYTSGAWTTTATTTNSSGTTHWTTTNLDGLGRTASVQARTGAGSRKTVLSEVDTVHAPCAWLPGCVSATGQLVQATFGSMVGPNDPSFRYRPEIGHITPISDTIGGPHYHNLLRTREMVLTINVLL